MVRRADDSWRKFYLDDNKGFSRWQVEQACIIWQKRARLWEWKEYIYIHMCWSKPPDGFGQATRCSVTLNTSTQQFKHFQAKHGEWHVQRNVNKCLHTFRWELSTMDPCVFWGHAIELYWPVKCEWQWMPCIWLHSLTGKCVRSILDPAEVIERRYNDQIGGKLEYYVHYDGCKRWTSVLFFLVARFVSVMCCPCQLAKTKTLLCRECCARSQFLSTKGALWWCVFLMLNKTYILLNQNYEILRMAWVSFCPKIFFIIFIFWTRITRVFLVHSILAQNSNAFWEHIVDQTSASSGRSSIAVNRRLDEWVGLDSIDLAQRIEDSALHGDTQIVVADLADSTDRKITRNQKRKHDEINHVQKVSSKVSPRSRPSDQGQGQMAWGEGHQHDLEHDLEVNVTLWPLLSNKIELLLPCHCFKKPNVRLTAPTTCNQTIVDLSVADLRWDGSDNSCAGEGARSGWYLSPIYLLTPVVRRIDIIPQSTICWHWRQFRRRCQLEVIQIDRISQENKAVLHAPFRRLSVSSDRAWNKLVLLSHKKTICKGRNQKLRATHSDDRKDWTLASGAFSSSRHSVEPRAQCNRNGVLCVCVRTWFDARWGRRKVSGI